MTFPLSTLVWYGRSGSRFTPSSTRNLVFAYRRKNFFGRMFTPSDCVPASVNVRTSLFEMPGMPWLWRSDHCDFDRDAVPEDRRQSHLLRHGVGALRSLG